MYINNVIYNMCYIYINSGTLIASYLREKIPISRDHIQMNLQLFVL